MLFLGHLTIGLWIISNGQEGSERTTPQIGQITKITQGHILSALDMMLPAQDCPHWVNKEARKMIWLSRDRNLEAPSQSALCLFSRTEIPPLPPTILFYPSASYGCPQACQCEPRITTLRRPDRPIAIDAGLSHEKPLLDLLTKRNLEYPDG